MIGYEYTYEFDVLWMDFWWFGDWLTMEYGNEELVM